MLIYFSYCSHAQLIERVGIKRIQNQGGTLLGMGERKLEIIEERQNDINIYRLHGQLDTNTSPEFEQRLFKAITDGTRNLVLNLKGLHYISSAGIRVLLKAINAIRRLNGRIILCCLEDYVKEVFEISGMGVLLPIFPTSDVALRSF